jgi:hypothetical protein
LAEHNQLVQFKSRSDIPVYHDQRVKAWIQQDPLAQFLDPDLYNDMTLSLDVGAEKAVRETHYPGVESGAQQCS